MKTTNTFWKVFLMAALVVIGLGSMAYTQLLVEKMRKKERTSVELWAKALQYNSKAHNVDIRREIEELMAETERMNTLTSTQKRKWIRVLQRADSELANAALDFVASELIIDDKFEIPSIVVDHHGEILYSRYVDEEDINQELIQRFSAVNAPIEIEVGEGEATQIQRVYFGESGTIALLRYYPLGQFVLLSVFLGLAYYSWSNIRKREQSNLWVGMAKEAAHQLGTPLSSLMGWLTLIKAEEQLPESTTMYVNELEQDVSRLERVADRFSKIGSTPERKPVNIDDSVQQSVEYIRKRLPKLGSHVSIHCEAHAGVQVNLNEQLFDWAIENLLKNAIDAIDVRSTRDGKIVVRTERVGKQVCIEVADNGKGIEKKFHQEIFKPGFSSKKRGWGLGLSLTKRIVEEYHDGRIFVKDATPGKGTTMRIELPLLGEGA